MLLRDSRHAALKKLMPLCPGGGFKPQAPATEDATTTVAHKCPKTCLTQVDLLFQVLDPDVRLQA